MIKNISVLGAGTMGRGIAIVFAMQGYRVNLYEAIASVRQKVMEQIKGELEFMISQEYITGEILKKTLECITLCGVLDEAVKEADYIIEAIPEVMELKQDLFKTLDELAPAHAIFASNTSSLPLREMMKDLRVERQKRMMICHWYNPPCFVPIVELSFFGNMEEALFQEVYQMYIRAEKRPVKVLKDVPGLLANRMLHALARETFSLMEQGVASLEDVDNALKFGPGFRSASTGMLEMADMGGLDIWCTVEDNLFKELNNTDQAFEMMRQKVREGKLGMKSGEGFYSYPEEIRQKMQDEFRKKMISQLKMQRSLESLKKKKNVSK